MEKQDSSFKFILDSHRHLIMHINVEYIWWDNMVPNENSIKLIAINTVPGNHAGFTY